MRVDRHHLIRLATNNGLIIKILLPHHPFFEKSGLKAVYKTTVNLVVHKEAFLDQKTAKKFIIKSNKIE